MNITHVLTLVPIVTVGLGYSTVGLLGHGLKHLYCETKWKKCCIECVVAGGVTQVRAWGCVKNMTGYNQTTFNVHTVITQNHNTPRSDLH